MDRLQRAGTLTVNDTAVHVWEGPVDEAGMRSVLRGVLLLLRQRGFYTEPDTRVSSIIRDGYYRGRRGDFEVRLTQCGRHLEVLFFQNVHRSNPYGGEYDFDKYQRMARTMQLICIVELSALLRRLVYYGYLWRSANDEVRDPRDLLAVRNAIRGSAPRGTLAAFNACWTAEQFERDETGWPSAKEIGLHLDRDGVPINNGEVRYARFRGRLIRGVVRPNMNGMWAVGAVAATFSSSELFFCEHPERERRRVVRGHRRRLEAELDRAHKARDYSRIEVLARVLRRLDEASDAAA